MKKTISILLICILSFQFFTRIGLLGYYVWNKNYIAEVLCINKDKPQVHCDGKCYLAEKIQETEPQENPSFPPAQQVKYQVPEFVISGEKTPASTVVIFSEKIYFNRYADSYISMYTGSIFHPPRIS